jgi:hypothetical protein
MATTSEGRLCGTVVDEDEEADLAARELAGMGWLPAVPLSVDVETVPVEHSA